MSYPTGSLGPGTGILDTRPGANSNSGASKAPSKNPELSFRRELRIDSATAQKIETWTGPYDKLLEKAKEYEFGSMVTDSELFPGGSDTEGTGWSYATVSNVSLSRNRGNVGTLVVTISQWRQEILVSIDHVEISRPILTWRKDSESNKPDLPKIQKWKKLEEAAWEDYAAFKVDGEELEGATRDLAEMIFNGIESYTLYAPVVTLALRTFSPPILSLKPVGEVAEAVKSPYPWKAARGIELEDVVRDCKNPITGMAWKWLVASSRVSPLSDGSYNWVLQFQGIDSVDSKLYDYTNGGGN
jgi:hypothetical protein